MWHLIGCTRNIFLENLNCFSFLMFLLKDHTVVCLFVTMPKWPKTQESGYLRSPNDQTNEKGTLLRQGNDRPWIQRKRNAICRPLLLLSDTDQLKETRSNVKTAMTMCAASPSHRELEWSKTERQVKCSFFQTKRQWQTQSNLNCVHVIKTKIKIAQRRKAK